MEIGYIARRSLIPALMQWVNSSRMKDHIPSDCYFIMLLEDTIFFHLSHLDSTYKVRHVLPDLESYSLQLWKNLDQTIQTWCVNNNIQSIEFQLRFLCEDRKFQCTRMVRVIKQDKPHTDYLDSKST